LQLCYRKVNIESICDTKCLGIQIFENLKWNNQAKSVIDKASRAFGFLKYINHFLPAAVAQALYTSFFEALLPILLLCLTLLRFLEHLTIAEAPKHSIVHLDQ